MSQQPAARAGRTASPARESGRRRRVVRMIKSKHGALGNLKSSFSRQPLPIPLPPPLRNTRGDGQSARQSRCSRASRRKRFAPPRRWTDESVSALGQLLDSALPGHVRSQPTAAPSRDHDPPAPFSSSSSSSPSSSSSSSFTTFYFYYFYLLLFFLYCTICCFNHVNFLPFLSAPHLVLSGAHPPPPLPPL